MRSSVFIATSLDGYIARKDGSIDWLGTVERPGEDYGYAKFFDSIDALVVGRKTYETALGFPSWPYGGKRCIVMTRLALEPKHGVEIYSGPIPDLCTRLAAEGVQRLYVDGGSIIRAFLGAGLVTDLTLSTLPILLGDGTPLFGSFGREVRVELVDSKTYPSGLVQSSYRVL